MVFIEHAYCNTTRGCAIDLAQTVPQSSDLVAGDFLKYKMAFRLLLQKREKRNEHKGGNFARNTPVSTEN